MNHNLKYGLYIGVITVVFTAIVFAMDYRLLQESWLSIVPTVVTVTILIIAGRDLKEQQGGYLSFKEAFVSSFIIFMIGAAINTTYQMVQYNVLAPDVAEVLRGENIDKAAQVMESLGANDKDIDEAMVEAENTNPFGIAAQSLALLFQAVLGLIVAAIIAAIVKKNKPEFE